MIAEQVIDLIVESGFRLTGREDIPPRLARLAQVPAVLAPKVADAVRQAYPEGVYAHQASAIEACLAGTDICLATSTASGKSLVFMAVAASICLTAIRSRVVCLYPAVALIHDQLEKWRAFLAPFNLSVEFVTGEVLTRERAARIQRADVVLMTPDVMHAWGMSHLGDAEVSLLLREARLVILDEAHVYDGVFGTNMAYFLRRVLALTPNARLIAATATIADPNALLRSLTGRTVEAFDSTTDGSPSSSRAVITVQPHAKGGFDAIATLLSRMSERGVGKFLAFADSRRMVERLVVASKRSHETSDEADSSTEVDEDSPRPVQGLLPYRAGYESEDRLAIESALRRGELRGVVSTSALELGLDIGDIDVVVLLTLPPSVKAFWQRVGRAGRRHESACLVIDEKDVIRSAFGGLGAYLDRPIEPNWLYLDNRFIQYAQALCAAAEISDAPWHDREALIGLPPAFARFLENEINPQEAVDPELYPLKQQAADGRPQYAFPLRSGLDKQFRVLNEGHRLGELSHAQALREAYPGAVYYYMARPYRVTRFDYFKGEVHTRRSAVYSTEALQQTMVFPRFPDRILRVWQAEGGYVAESEIQVSERVLGFREVRGSTKNDHRYGPTSEYSQKDLMRFFETTGVCWSAPVSGLSNQLVNDLILEAFCVLFGIQSRDLGRGPYHARTGPFGGGTAKGESIYDGVRGSLRLTEQLGQNFAQVIEAAAHLAEVRGHADAIAALRPLASWASGLRPASPTQAGSATQPMEDDWVQLIGIAQPAILHNGDYARMVTVTAFHYTPRGWVYEVESDDEATHRVPADLLTAIPGETRLVSYNVMTGESRDIS
ncbi:MAG: hypothetical protein AMXMBFR23_23870 [Chloroflexota bacterium]